MPNDILLAVKSLAVRYRNGALGISDVSFSVAAGEIVALLGANGAGKSTTLRAVGGFMRSEGARITRGRVLLDGSDITQFEPHLVAARGVATVMERRKVFANLSVMDNLLALGPRQLGPDRSSRLADVFELFPALGQRRGELAGRLSGGQQQMLALGRSMMAAPRLLLIDEVTLGLHPNLHGVLFAAIRRIAASGAGILIVDESATTAQAVAAQAHWLVAGSLGAGAPDAG